MAVVTLMPKTRMRWKGSAVCRASSRIRSCRRADGPTPSGRKIRRMSYIPVARHFRHRRVGATDRLHVSFDSMLDMPEKFLHRVPGRGYRPELSGRR
jgi:hypothetical protein